MLKIGAIKGMAQLLNQLSDVAEFDQSSALKSGGDVVLPYMQSITPVDTGELKDSEHLEFDGNTMNIVADADHAVAVEMGTSRMAARPFMRTAVQDRHTDALQAMAENIQEQIGTAVNG